MPPQSAEAKAGAAEIVAVLIWTMLCDLLVFRFRGFNAAAVFLVAATVLILALSMLRRRPEEAAGPTAKWLLVILTLAIAARLAWLGDWFGACYGGGVWLALVVASSGLWPGLLNLEHTLLWSPIGGFLRVRSYQSVDAVNRRRETTVDAPELNEDGGGSAAVWMPLAAVGLFGLLFLFANPDLLQSLIAKVKPWGNRLVEYLMELSPLEIPFCIAAFLIGAGLLRPLASTPWIVNLTGEATKRSSPKTSMVLNTAYRNTLVALILLFALYLPYEFYTLWRRDFPDGFYYAGYAHQGALWLTIALAIATVLLSHIFGRVAVAASATVRLKRIAWVWSGLNLLLAAAVYNRLLIYIGYNGMTRMRVIGLFGITLVVAGFLIVVYKIARDRDFVWLIRRQIAAALVVTGLHTATPIDYLVHRYNVTQVLGGNLRPSVMIAVKPIDDGGMISLPALVNHPDPIIANGVRAMLAQRSLQIRERVSSVPWHWHHHQWATKLAYHRIWQTRRSWAGYRDDPAARSAAIDALKKYAMRWY